MEANYQTEIFDWKEKDALESFKDANPNGHVVDSSDDQFVYVYGDRSITAEQAQTYFDGLFDYEDYK